ncbi:MAG: O-antigen ligase family protein [Chloroflexi bacterium]|nr:O-antigen ligase family protein [Chloroflexota bacterium]
MQPRRGWLLPAAVAVAAVVTVGALGLMSLLDRGVTYGTADLGELRDADSPAIGANTFLHREPDPAKVRRELAVLRAAGVTLIRQEFNWAEFEPLDPDQHPDLGRDAWIKYDHIVNAARDAGIQILARLDRAPVWATPGFDPRANPWMQAPPADNAEFARFARQLATRYRGKVRYYQVWNEPNLFGEWGGRPPDPADYLAMLRTVGQAIRAADPDARIVLAGLAPTIETGPENLSDLLFLRNLYQLGARGDFDVAATMSYGLWTGPRDIRIDDQRVNFPRAVLWREAMLEFGDAQTPVWATEYGWMSLPPGWAGDPGIWGNHPIDVQAAWTVDGIRRARDQWSWMPTIVIWASRWPEDLGPRDPTPYFRLMDKDFTPRPNLQAVAKAFAGSPAAGVGLHQESHLAASYRGPWPRVPSDLASLTLQRQTGVAGANVTFTFQGADVGLLTRRGPDMGRVLARIDGQDALADALPRNPAGEAILDLYAPSVQPLARIPIATRLPPGLHTLELTVVAESNPASTGGLVIVDGFLVGNARPVWPWLALAAVWAAVGALALGTARGWRPAQLALASVSWSWMDRRVGPLRLGELLLALAALLYAALPAGGPLSVWTLVRILLALAIGLMALARLRYAALVAVAAVPFVGVIGRTGLIDRPVGEVLILAVVAAWIARAFWCGPPRLPPRRWLAAAVVFAAAGIVAAGLADFPKFALRDLRTVILEPAAFFVVLASVLRDRRDARRLLAALVVGAVLVALTALALIPFGAVVTEVFPPRLRGTFGSPNNLALVLERAAPVALGLALAAGASTFVSGRCCWGLGRVASARALWGLALLGLGAVLILTWSRGAWLGALLGLAVASRPLWAQARPGRRVAAVALPLVALVAVVPVTGAERIGQLLRVGDSGAVSRLAIWDAAWRMGRDNWLFGVGPDNFLTHYRAFMRPEAWREPNISHPHNLLLDAWVSLGVVGLVALVGLLVLFWRDWACARRMADGRSDPLAFGLAGAMTAALIHGLVDHAYFLPELAAYFWILSAAATLFAHPQGYPSRSAGAPSEPGLAAARAAGNPEPRLAA